ncbi:MAG: hypothetical protein CMM94_02470 [Rickettsiales bacterium]|nr:hypothetical protein [Rickettsiales bacterium]
MPESENPTVGQRVDGAVDAAGDAARGAIEDPGGTASNVWQGTQNLLGGLWDFIKDNGATVIGGIGGFLGGRMITGMFGGGEGQGMWSAIFGGITTLGLTVIGAVMGARFAEGRGWRDNDEPAADAAERGADAAERGAQAERRSTVDVTRAQTEARVIETADGRLRYEGNGTLDAEERGRLGEMLGEYRSEVNPAGGITASPEEASIASVTVPADLPQEQREEIAGMVRD